jgi:hypothetical protein
VRRVLVIMLFAVALARSQEDVPPMVMGSITAAVAPEIAFADSLKGTSSFTKPALFPVTLTAGATAVTIGVEWYTGAEADVDSVHIDNGASQLKLTKGGTTGAGNSKKSSFFYGSGAPTGTDTVKVWSSTTAGNTTALNICGASWSGVGSFAGYDDSSNTWTTANRLTFTSASGEVIGFFVGTEGQTPTIDSTHRCVQTATDFVEGFHSALGAATVIVNSSQASAGKLYMHGVRMLKP